MPLGLYFDDLKVGQEWESTCQTVTETDVVHFANLSGDFNPIHLDREFARATPYRRPIAHGLLTLSLGSGLLQQAPHVQTLAFLGISDWNFVAPVYPGDTIRVRSRIQQLDVRGTGRRGEVTWRHEIVNQDGKGVQSGVTRTLVAARQSRRATHDPKQKLAPSQSNGLSCPVA